MAVENQVITEEYAIYNGDSAEVLQTFPDESMDLILYSPPFGTDSGGLFHYSSSEHDLSNARNYAEFFEHYAYIVEQTHRLLKPGRIAAVHCMDTPKDGANICGYKDFPGDIIRLHEKIGFEYTPRICIWKEPLGVRNRTMSKALTHRQIVEDATQTNVAAADYLIPFRKRGTNPVPVVHKHGLTSYAGSRTVPPNLMKYRGWKGNQIQNRYSHWIWRQYASCFWDDVRIERVLPYKEGRDAEDERHLHPLQLDVIERCVVLWTNPGENVLTPFMGVGSEVVGSVMNGRRGIGVELKASYFRQACKNLPWALEQARIEDSDLFASVAEPTLEEQPSWES
jgi:DNA modification methylase